MRRLVISALFVLVSATGCSSSHEEVSKTPVSQSPTSPTASRSASEETASSSAAATPSAAPSAAAVRASGPSLDQLYATVRQNGPNGTDQALANNPGSIDYCNRLLGDAKPLLSAGGFGGATAGNVVSEVASTSTITGGNLFINGGDDIGCMQAAEFGAFLTPAPPGEIFTTGLTKLPFGQECYSGKTDQGSSGTDLACITPNGWGIDVWVVGPASVDESVLRQTYERLANDLRSAPSF